MRHLETYPEPEVQFLLSILNPNIFKASSPSLDPETLDLNPEPRIPQTHKPINPQNPTPKPLTLYPILGAEYPSPDKVNLLNYSRIINPKRLNVTYSATKL